MQSISSQEQALDFIAHPMTPCVLRVQALYPEGSADPAPVETLVNDIELAKEQAG